MKVFFSRLCSLVCLGRTLSSFSYFSDGSLSWSNPNLGLLTNISVMAIC